MTRALSPRTVVGTLVLTALLCAPPALAQQAAESRPSRPTAADETFDLDIPLRRIAEEEYRASTEAVAEGAAVRVRVGAFVRAERVEIVLRNVRGFVRFRADLDPVLRLLNARREAAPASDVPSP